MLFGVYSMRVYYLICQALNQAGLINVRIIQSVFLVRSAGHLNGIKSLSVTIRSTVGAFVVNFRQTLFYS